MSENVANQTVFFLKKNNKNRIKNNNKIKCVGPKVWEVNTYSQNESRILFPITNKMCGKATLLVLCKI